MATNLTDAPSWYNTLAGAAGGQAQSLNQQQAASTYITSIGTVYTGLSYSNPTINALQVLSPGWRYVRWYKPDDADAVAESIPIVALAHSNHSVAYVLGEAKPTLSTKTPHDVAHFLAVLAPGEPYDEQVWHEKARKAHYEFHSAEVAKRLLKGAPAEAPAA